MQKNEVRDLSRKFTSDLPTALQEEIQAALKGIPAAKDIQLENGCTVSQLEDRFGLDVNGLPHAKDWELQLSLERQFTTALSPASQKMIETTLAEIPDAKGICLDDGYTVGQLAKRFGTSLVDKLLSIISPK